MISYRTAAALLAATCLLSACTTSPPVPGETGTVTLTPEVGRFTAVTVGTGFTAETRRGGSPAVSITVPESVQDRVVARVSGERLEISLQPAPGPFAPGSATATITVAEPLTELVALQAASVNATASGSLDGDVRIQAREASTVTATVNAGQLTVETTEGSTVTATGQTDTATVTAGSAATFKGFDLQARAATATASAASTIEVTATATLTAKAVEGSTVSYRGSPQLSIDRDVSSTVEPD